jgi:SAM-dependent methyltransferase
MNSGSDAFGLALRDWTVGVLDPEIVERDDGHIELGAGPTGYFADVEEWPASERDAIVQIRGRVLDVGCGAGRVALHLQLLGYDVMGLDYSRLAVRTTKERGVRKTQVGSIESVSALIARYESILLFGNNMGVFGSPARAKRLLLEWSRSARPGTRLFLESTDPASGGAPILDRAYVLRNQQRGKPVGQCRMRIWYAGQHSDWIPWFFVSRSDMRAILRDAGWRLVRFVASGRREPYVGIFERPELGWSPGPRTRRQMVGRFVGS